MIAAPRHTAPRDPGARLVAAILAHGAAAGCAADLVSLHQRDWASATFLGLRQHIVLAVAPGDARTAWLASLAEDVFVVPRHCLADLAVTAAVDSHHVAIETLLLIDG